MPTSECEESGVASLDDPRVGGEFVRTVPGDGDVVLVGVVHDHPASVHRCRAVTGAVDPDVVALELPGVALPLFERLAREEDADEMSATIAAAGDARVAGIDTVGRRFARHFLDGARREGASLATLRRAARSTAGVVRHAVSCRVAAHRSPGGEGLRAKGAPLEYDTGAADPPATQASDERTHVARSRALLGATERPHAERLLDDARERTMAANLDDLREEGTVVAVVGIDHLDAIADRLRGPPADADD